MSRDRDDVEDILRDIRRELREEHEANADRFEQILELHQSVFKLALFNFELDAARLRMGEEGTFHKDVRDRREAFVRHVIDGLDDVLEPK